MEEKKVQVVNGGFPEQQEQEVEVQTIKGYEKLGEAGERFLKMVHKEHMRACGTETQKEFAFLNITSVKVNPRERCVETRFANGELVKYYFDFTWG